MENKDTSEGNQSIDEELNSANEKIEKTVMQAPIEKAEVETSTHHPNVKPPTFWKRITRFFKRIVAIFLVFGKTILNGIKSFFVGIYHFFLWIGRTLRGIGQAIKSEIPILKEDWKEYSDEHHISVSTTRRYFRLKIQSWKKTFSTVDTSREKMHEMLFAGNTKVGQLFEKMLMVLIVVSVFFVMLDSVAAIHNKIGWLLIVFEWIFTIFFTIEYFMRIYSSPHPIRYMTSFFGIIDLISIIPTYISAIMVSSHAFLMLRVLRFLRVFRLLRLVKFMKAGNTIINALNASKEKIAVFMIFIMLVVTIMGGILYVVEFEEGSGFTSIPTSIYWAIITLTTVGYGDITPVTWLGQLIASVIMLMGYSILAVPTGIVSAELVKEAKKEKKKCECVRCGKKKHELKARFCNRCGEQLAEND